MRLYLIRHGETDHNRNRVVQGHAEIPLNDRGIHQAAKTAERLAGMPVDLIVSSDLRRAVMTAAIIAARTYAPLVYDPLFRERDPGIHTGHPYDEAVPFFTDKTYEPPQGETVDVFEERVRKAFDGLTVREGGTDCNICLVTHGMVCTAFCDLYLGEHHDVPTSAGWGNGSISILDYDGEWHVVNIADASHLGDDKPLPSMGGG